MSDTEKYNGPRTGAFLWIVVAVALVALFCTLGPCAAHGAPRAKPPSGISGGQCSTITKTVSFEYCCGTGTPDAGTPPTDGGTPPTDGGTPGAGDWLHTDGNKIFRADGTRWMGRGANVFDTRSCNACAYQSPDVNEVKRRATALLDQGANFIRLDLESYASLQGRVHGLSFTVDPAYLNDIENIVAFISQRPGAYVLVSLWLDPSIGNEGRPTQATADAWKVLAKRLAPYPRAFYGVVNEPSNNYDGSGDAVTWEGMNTVVQAIRAQEDADGTPHHLIAVQGTGGWARLLHYYVTHPIPSDNVIYEIHVYNPQSDFDWLLNDATAVLPVVIGEFGPYSGLMTLDDTAALMTRANTQGIPWAAWSFHMRCPPNLLVDTSSGGCGIGMVLQPTEFGRQVGSYFAPQLFVRKPGPRGPRR